jgi:glycosyltransferase involved in cell wall biosynthesis
MKLSILIPTLESRREKFDALCQVLFDQINSNPEIDHHDILFHTIRDAGQMSIGVKRQRLLEQAQGDYICFIDDDDMVPDDYVAKILNAIESEPDCCSLTGELHWPNGGIERFEHSIDYDKWEKKDNVYLRYPNHLNAVKRELALQVGFKDLRHGEDRDYSDRLKPLLKTEAKIEGVIYHYMMR